MKKLRGRLFVLCVVILCCARGHSAQEPCRLERSVAPDYGGVMLGMRLEEAGRMFPGSRELQTGPGAATATKPFVVSLGMLELGVRKEEFKGVEELMLTFIGGTVHRIDVRFHSPVEWKAVTEFSDYASKRLALPADSWDAPASDAAKQSRVLDCRGFAVVVRMDKNGPSTLSIVDTSVGKSDGSESGDKRHRGEAPVSNPTSPRSPARKRPA
jgi:hypothetical protein